MRLLKAQNTNLRNIYGAGVRYDVNGQVIMDSTNTVLVPKGTTAQRPSTSVNGHLRYNTDDDRFEIYEADEWYGLRVAAPSTSAPITVQTLGYGDGVETIFGPLESGDTDYPNPAAAQNILVFVENVYQLPTTNYTLVQNPASANTIESIVSVGATTVIETTTAHGFEADDLIFIGGVNAAGDAIENLNNDDSSSPTSHTITSIPSTTRIEVAVDTSGGDVNTYAGLGGQKGIIKKASSIDGQAYDDGYFLEFSSAVDLNKPITVLHNFDK